MVQRPADRPIVHPVRVGRVAVNYRTLPARLSCSRRGHCGAELPPVGLAGRVTPARRKLYRPVACLAGPWRLESRTCLSDRVVVAFLPKNTGFVGGTPPDFVVVTRRRGPSHRRRHVQWDLPVLGVAISLSFAEAGPRRCRQTWHKTK